MTLKKWVELRGGASRVAQILEVSRQTVYMWVWGKGGMHYETALRIVHLSKGQLTLEGIYAEARGYPRKKKGSRA